MASEARKNRYGRFASSDLSEIWSLLSRQERLEGLKALPKTEIFDFFLGLTTHDQAEMLQSMTEERRKGWIQSLPPDDLADIVQVLDPEDRIKFLSFMDDLTRREVSALMAYAEDVAGGLMSPRYVRVRPDMTVDEALSYLRRQVQERAENVYEAYVLDAEQKLMGVVTLRDLLAFPSQSVIRDIMQTDVVTVPEDMDQEGVSRLFSRYNRVAIPVVDQDHRMKGIVTIDDIVDVVQEEATEDFQKIGATETLNAPYLKVGLLQMVRKRAVWLSVLFLGEMFTASAMGFFKMEILQAVVLALFIPLIISSGGNSGSQASTLVIRAMALGDVRLRDWWRVVLREISSGVVLGLILGVIGLLRVVLWPGKGTIYGEHYFLIGLTVSVSLVGVVLMGTLTGSMLPFILRRFGFDPAMASAPFVATLVDVSGVAIYFSLAQIFLRGTLL